MYFAPDQVTLIRCFSLYGSIKEYFDNLNEIMRSTSICHQYHHGTKKIDQVIIET